MLRTISRHSRGFALYPTTSPRQTKWVQSRSRASARTASVASRLACRSLMIAKRIRVGMVKWLEALQKLKREIFVMPRLRDPVLRGDIQLVFQLFEMPKQG